MLMNGNGDKMAESRQFLAHYSASRGKTKTSSSYNENSVAAVELVLLFVLFCFRLCKSIKSINESKAENQPVSNVLF